jgi:ankyrin repeat protein
LHYAANNPSPEGAAAAIRLLVAVGADVAARDGRGFQALHWAVAHSKFAFLDPSADFVKSLRRGAVDVGEPFQYGRDGSQVSFVGTLPHPPKASADMKTADSIGWQTLDLATSTDQMLLRQRPINLLLAAGAGVLAHTDTDGKQPLL